MGAVNYFVNDYSNTCNTSYVPLVTHEFLVIGGNRIPINRKRLQADFMPDPTNVPEHYQCRGTNRDQDSHRRTIRVETGTPTTVVALFTRRN